MRIKKHIYYIGIVSLISLLSLTGCYREPPLHLYDWENPAIEIPMAEVQLDLYWNYYNYDWKSEWYYGDQGREGGWDEEDRQKFGELEYVEPAHFFIYRYYKGEENNGTRLTKDSKYSRSRTFRASYEWGWWDILAWNDVKTIDGIQNLNFEEKESLDEPIMAMTNSTQYSSRYHAPRYQNSFYQPEPLFAACEENVEINRNLKDFVYDEETNIWVRKLKMYLEPLTYIYLPQVILHNNYMPAIGCDRIVSVPNTADLSGMARSTCLNTGIASNDPIAVNFKMRLKQEKDFRNGEKVDIVGGRLMTFGICGQNGNRISSADESIDSQRHYLDVNMVFYNGMDSTFVFDVTDQVRERYKGGVITVELDMDTVPIPRRSGGSGFNAVVADYEYRTWYFDFDSIPKN